MCLSDHKVNSRQVRQSYQQMITQRKKYTSQKQLPKFTICILQYMEIGPINSQNQNTTCFSCLFCLPCCHQLKNRNVRKQLQYAYQSCSSKQQLDYYRKFINYMTNNQIQLPYASPRTTLLQQLKTNQCLLNSNQQTIFNALIKGKLTWSLQSTMKLDHRRYLLYYKQLKNIHQNCLNLRNYILRKSKHPQINAFVLQCIVPVQPNKIKFAIPQFMQNSNQIIKKLKQVVDKALYQNVKVWKQTVIHIPNYRYQKDQINKQKQIKQLISKDQQYHHQSQSNKKKQTSNLININQSNLKQSIAKNNKNNKKQNQIIKSDTFNNSNNLFYNQKNPYIPTKQGTKSVSNERDKNTNTTFKKTKKQPGQPQQQALNLTIKSQQNRRNFAQRPEKTQSQEAWHPTKFAIPTNNQLNDINTKLTGATTKLTNGNTQLNGINVQLNKVQIKQHNHLQQKIDSGKSLLTDQIKTQKNSQNLSQIIYQQQQFGNVSQLSGQTFQTISDCNK